MKTTLETPRLTGQTRDAGFEIGVRRTFDISTAAAWQALTTPQGLRLWLGEIDRLPVMEKGTVYQTADGVTGEVRGGRPGAYIRLTWQPAGRVSLSTLQVRVLPAGEKATISFHQERLAGPQEREQMRAHWVRVMEKLEELFR